MNACLYLLASAMVLSGPLDRQPATSNSLVIERCLVDLLDERKIPAEEAGKITSLEAREGVTVHSGSRLGAIDDRMAQADLQVAQFEAAVAAEQAGNDVNVRYAEKSRDVAKAEYEQAVEANHKAPLAISHAEVRRLWFALERAKLQIEQAALEQRVAEMQSDATAAKVHQAEVALERRQIYSPIEGMIVEVLRKEGEWVNPGDTLLRIIRLDKLRVKGSVDAQRFTPSELLGRPIVLEVELARGRVVSLPGKVEFVNPELNDLNQFNIWAEVENQQQGGYWVVEPGRTGRMTIDMSGVQAR